MSDGNERQNSTVKLNDGRTSVDQIEIESMTFRFGKQGSADMADLLRRSDDPSYELLIRSALTLYSVYVDQRNKGVKEVHFPQTDGTVEHFTFTR
ncbi:MAG: hypothetical protein WC477_00895 [Patescibacteria group bacterium]